MREITVKASRLPLHKGSRVPGYPSLTVGEYVGGSPYTFDRIYDIVDKDGKSSGLVIKVCWQPLGVPLGMSMRALEHEWVMYNNIKVFSSKHPDLSTQLLHAQAAILTSDPPSSIIGCCSGVSSSQHQGKHQHQQQQQYGVADGSSSSDGGSSSSSDNVDVHEVTPGDAAASVSSATSTPRRTVAALIVEKANGLTVKQRIKKKGFNNIRYVAELLLQLPQLLKVLESELGFVHDDLRLDNIMETWQDHTTAAAAAAGAAAAASNGYAPSAARPSNSSSSKHGRGDALASPARQLSNPDSQPRDQELKQRQHSDLKKGTASSSNSDSNDTDGCTSGSATPTFVLFDFGLSIINPDPYSRGEESRASPQQKKEALERLYQQGYVFHKALGVVNLFHVFQFGRAADVYRLCKSLSGHLSKRTWPATDRPLVEATLQLLATISGKSITAYFAEDLAVKSGHAGDGGDSGQAESTGADGKSQQRQHGAPLGDRPVVLASSKATKKLCIAVQPSSNDGRKGLLGLSHWLQQRKQQKQMQREFVGISAAQLMQLKQYQQLAHVMKHSTGKGEDYDRSQ